MIVDMAVHFILGLEGLRADSTAKCEAVTNALKSEHTMLLKDVAVRLLGVLAQKTDTLTTLALDLSQVLGDLDDASLQYGPCVVCFSLGIS